MTTRKYSTTQDYFTTTEIIMCILVFINFIALVVLGGSLVFWFQKEVTAVKPFDFPDKSHEVVEDVSNLEIIREPKKEWKTGFASWYDYSLKGYPNYSREHFTAASRDYPKGTKLQVCYDSILNEKFTTCVTVRVNDYGPDKTKHPDRIIDLSSAAFSKLAPLSWGLIGVRVSKID